MITQSIVPMLTDLKFHFCNETSAKVHRNMGAQILHIFDETIDQVSNLW